MRLDAKYQDQQKQFFTCFTDNEKIFDKLQHFRILACLKRKGLNKNDTNVMINASYGKTFSNHSFL